MTRRNSQETRRPIKPHKPTPLTKNGFTYDDDGLTTLAFQWNSLEQIRTILFSDNITTAVRRNTVELPNKERGKGYKPWLCAQMSHYGIPFDANETTIKLKKQMIDAVESGKCDQVPASILALRSELSDAWESKVKDYDEKLAAWNADSERRKDETFQQLRSPMAEANYDAVRFVSKYFRDSQGRSDPTKTPEPITLPNLDSLARCNLIREAGKVDGLYTAERFMYYKDTPFAIGWDHDVVKSIVKAIEDEELRKADERKAQMEKPLLEQHERLKHDAKDWPDFNLNDITGAYMVKCEQIESEWPDEEGLMQLNIESGGYATFHFRVLEGEMHLSKSRPLVEPDSDSSDEEQENNDEESRGSDTSLNSRKRKAPTESNDRSAKRRNSAEEKSRKVHFSWSGEETGEGETQEDGNGFHNIGCLRFNRTLTKFKGTMNIGFVSGDCILTGFKTSHTPGKTPSTVSGGFL